MPRPRIRWTNCRPIKLRRGALDVLVASLRITPTRLPVEAVTDEWWQAVISDPRARSRPQRMGYVPIASPVATIGQMQRMGLGGWTWAWCGRGTILCGHRVPIALAPFAIRWGLDASSDMIRANMVCGKCGHRGVTLTAPSYGDSQIGFMLFPTMVSDD